MEKRKIKWRGRSLAIIYTPEKFGMGEHIEPHTDNKVGLSVTETGYRPKFVASGRQAKHCGAVAT